jgi:hydrogenase expression/formation protein HypC
MCLAIPGQIVAIDDAARKLAVVDVAGVRRQINIVCIVDDDHPVASCVGDWVLVHVGFAMTRIDEAQAQATLQILRELGEAQVETREATEMRSELEALYPSDGRGAARGTVP